MPAPATVRASGFFAATRAGMEAGEATLRMSSATRGTLSFGGRQWRVTGDPAAKTLRAKAGCTVAQLTIVNRGRIVGSVEGDALELVRAVLRPIPAAEMAQSDAGPQGAIKTIMNSVPDYEAAVGDSTTFWYAFGPVLYRGRLDGSARVLCIASDPGPTECLPFMRRTLVGDSGQKVQGFLAKLGLTRSYVLVNAFAVAMHPGKKTKGLRVLKTNAAIRSARHAMYDHLLTSNVQAIIAFGEVAQLAYELWRASNPAVKGVSHVELAHPAAVDRDGSGNDSALAAWARAVRKLRQLVSPDAGGDAGGPNYGAYFTENDYARIPRWDLPAAAPAYAGDDSWGRGSTPQHNNCCARPVPDDGASLVLTPPPGQGQTLRYIYSKGALVGARTKGGKQVAIDASGIPI